MIKWRAWFADGNIYNAKDHTWDGIPNDGVVIVVVYQGWIPSSNQTKRYRRINDGYDTYMILDDTIICNNYTIEENKERYPQAYGYKLGQWVSDSEFNRISQEAWNSKWFDEVDSS